jgi:hypothetical protein
MFIVSGGRGIGKTRRLLEAAQATNSVVACKDPIKMTERAHKYGITGLHIIQYDDLHSTGSEATIYIHDVEAFVKHAFPGVAGFSVTVD